MMGKKKLTIVSRGSSKSFREDCKVDDGRADGRGKGNVEN